MGYLNPLLKLPAGRALQTLPQADRERIAAVMRDLRAQANVEAENSWKRRKGPMAAYWRAVSTYARHVAHALAGVAIAAQAVPACNCGARAEGDADQTMHSHDCSIYSRPTSANAPPA